MAVPKQMSDLIIGNLRGGFNDTDPPTSLPDDQCVVAENVEFFYSLLGERRNGCAPMSLSGSGLDTMGSIIHLSQRFPTNDPNVGELWAVGVDLTAHTSMWAYRSNEDEWTPVTPVDDLHADISNSGLQIVGVPYQNKHFFAADMLTHGTDQTDAVATAANHINRLYVWDGTHLRRAGLVQPDVPTVTTHGSGTYATTRYFRIRATAQDGSGNTLRRSEPSDTVTFAPPGTGDGATITYPSYDADEFATHWELEASADGSTFYVIATVAIATASSLDTTADPTTYATFTLSEDIGEYLLQPSSRFIMVDGDRLIFAGHWTDQTLMSTVGWTPVSTAPGVGNDERFPLNSSASNGDNRVVLDNYEGGGITGLSQTANGSFYVFKWSHIYQATRTGNTGSAGSAYDFTCLSKIRGALPGSVVSGMDEYGRPCIYFLDPLTGPSRISTSGVQAINGVRNTWKRVNRLATGVVSHGIYYPEKRQVWWWIAADSANFPTLGLKLQVNETREDQSNNVIRGWSTFTGRIAEAYCSSIVNVEIRDDQGDIATISRRPYIGLTAPSFIQQCDLLSTDDGTTYVARITTKPYLVTGLLNKWGAMTCALLANANAGSDVEVSCIRDFGVETKSATTDFSPTASETMVIKVFDSLVLSSSKSLQFEFSDPS